MTQQSFSVTGLHCGGCVKTVSEALLALPDVRAVDVTLGDGTPSTVHIDADGELDTDRVQAALDARGSFQVQR